MDVRPRSGPPARTDLSPYGIDASGRIYRNPTTSLLYKHALQRGDGQLAEGGPLAVDTGTFTGRSPKDKFLVEEPSSSDRIWWGDVNQKLSESHFHSLRAKVTARLGDAGAVYVVDAWVGADPKHRMGVRVVTAHPDHALFAKTTFIELDPGSDSTFAPQALAPAHAGPGRQPAGGRDAHVDRRGAAPGSYRAARLRHVLRRRDQEGDLHRYERQAPAGRGLSDALLGERR